MLQSYYVKDKALAEIFTYLLITYESYTGGALPKIDYEKIKSTYLYDKTLLNDFIDYVKKAPEELLFSDPNKTAVDVLNDLIGAGAINSYEYNTLKERHLLYK